MAGSASGSPLAGMVGGARPSPRSPLALSAAPADPLSWLVAMTWEGSGHAICVVSFVVRMAPVSVLRKFTPCPRSPCLPPLARKGGHTMSRLGMQSGVLPECHQGPPTLGPLVQLPTLFPLPPPLGSQWGKGVCQGSLAAVPMGLLADSSPEQEGESYLIEGISPVTTQWAVL